MKGVKTQMNLKTALLSIDKFVHCNSEHILTGLAVGGVIVTGIQAYRAGLKCDEILKKRKEDIDLCDEDDKAAKWAVNFECIKEITPIVIPPIIFGGLTITSAIAANRVSAKKLAMLSAAYAVSERALKEKDEKIEALFGKKNAQKVREDISKDDILRNPPPSDLNMIYATGKGHIPCRDKFDGGWFYSDAVYIGKAINELSHQCLLDMYVSLNEFYILLGRECTDMGEMFGWNQDDLISGSLPITFSAHLTDTGVPCLQLEYRVHPRFDYRELR